MDEAFPDPGVRFGCGSLSTAAMAQCSVARVPVVFRSCLRRSCLTGRFLARGWLRPSLPRGFSAQSPLPRQAPLRLPPSGARRGEDPSLSLRFALCPGGASSRLPVTSNAPFKKSHPRHGWHMRWTPRVLSPEFGAVSFGAYPSWLTGTSPS